MSPSESLVVFRNSSREVSRRELREYAAHLAAEVAGGRSFCCLIADDDELARLNQQFRGKHYPTDVLSFPSGAGAGSLGDMAVSLDRAREQAREHDHSVTEEIKILMLHGLLHLLGMDHETDGGRMRRAERQWRRKLGLPSGLIERAHV
jgi:probable rRNA maturation factor